MGGHNQLRKKRVGPVSRSSKTAFWQRRVVNTARKVRDFHCNFLRYEHTGATVKPTRGAYWP